MFSESHSVRLLDSEAIQKSAERTKTPCDAVDQSFKLAIRFREQTSGDTDFEHVGLTYWQ